MLEIEKPTILDANNKELEVGQYVIFEGFATGKKRLGLVTDLNGVLLEVFDAQSQKTFSSYSNWRFTILDPKTPEWQAEIQDLNKNFEAWFNR